ncbi:LacI family transcriptional regulator [Microbacterium sp. EYE_5]|uniref:LacI family DNA-binding transcriptional regulator n=1 Tax=unclassified Microbacterium TaxID=2609290 RepID=UPI002002DE94|nr:MULTISPECIES: LacI family DNA-binding transcriptional regulator [unclassified Microbacterium]MCK6081651.1 LacI family transcriptional regulator [Microbacterium sp. EYE_382]MCK6086921.1 LacI family transcriptional regulator [Microbacterium sp. EYE_384]MCK6123581.1 LacI family transcriptional regulator [Microbacterium sp. EYE_80]MCK6126490.1 LacI family transcriptional regulator [Microbacterium sp. EYE_79]MCK6142605.1 LacI family transcriptional regulator [Microbacterium sp. EYE_39]
MTVQQRATLDDVARLAGVSSKTVSRVFAQRELVAPLTVERVLGAAKRLRFRPNSLAQGLRRGGSRTVGFIIGELSNPFYYKVAAGIEKELSAHGFSLVVATTDDTEEGEGRVADALLAQRVGALLLIPVGDDQSYLEGERQLGTPVIAIDRPARNLAADAIVLDNRAAVLEATRRLVTRGHRRIAYVCNPASVWTQSERLAGYRQALSEVGVDSTPWEVLGDDLALSPTDLVRALWADGDGPTAVIAGNNRVTVGALRVLRERGDERTALVGFDDFDTGDVLGVSVISYDPLELGRRAAQLAIERIGDPSGFVRQITLPTWIIERGTGERPPFD